MRHSVLLSVCAVAGMALPAMADGTILSFGFTDLSSSYNQGTMVYQAVGVNTPLLSTAGNVNRHLNPVVTAIYNPGSADGRVGVSLSISNIVGNSATGNGSIFIEDADGDRFVANISGNFIHTSPAVFFNGILSDIAFVPAPGTNNIFNGPSGGSFPLTFAPSEPPFTGAVVQLFFDTQGTFFTQSFSNIPSQVNGAVIPSPSALAVVGLGGLIAARRRRFR